MEYTEAERRAQRHADEQNEAWVVYYVADNGLYGCAAREHFPHTKKMAAKRGHDLIERVLVFPVGYTPVILATGIEEGGMVQEAARWVDEALDTPIGAPPFKYRNADGMEHTILVDFSGVTDSGYVAGEPHVVLDTRELLEDLRTLLGPA